MKKYGIIYADPPWRYTDFSPPQGSCPYPTLTLEDIKGLPVPEICAGDCVLFLWTTMPLLKEAIDVIESWGFKYTTCAFTWVKLNPRGGVPLFAGDKWYLGLGRWTRSNAELCLMGKMGKPTRIAADVRQIQVYPRARHSAKPPQIRNEIVRLMGDLPRIELFAREKIDGWDAWGNEVESDIALNREGNNACNLSTERPRG